MSHTTPLVDNEVRKIFSDPEKRRAWVKYQITISGTSMAQIAKENGVARETLYSAFKRTYPKMEKVIADSVGLEPKVLFPDRYQPNGLPINRRGRPRKS